jgi:hypothetical protein
VVEHIVAVWVDTGQAWLKERMALDLGEDEFTDTASANVPEVFADLHILIEPERSRNFLAGRANGTLALRLRLFLLRSHLHDLLGYRLWLDDASSVDTCCWLSSSYPSRSGRSACSWRVTNGYGISARP